MELHEQGLEALAPADEKGLLGRISELEARLAAAELALGAGGVERLRQGEELEEARQMLAGVLDGGLDGVIYCRTLRDAAGAVIDYEIALMNRSAERLTGQPAATTLGRRMMEVFPGSVDTGLFAMYLQVEESGVPGLMEVYYGYDNVDLWIRISAVKVLQGLAFTFTDITAYKVAERELEAQKSLAEALIHHAPIAISYLDRGLCYARVNPVAALQAGLAPAEMIGRSIFEVGGPETRRQLGPILEAALAGEARTEVSFAFSFSHEGTEREVSFDFSTVPLRGEGGLVTGILVIAQDTSQRVEVARLQAERITNLEEANKHKEQFLGILSHELRTPINAIEGFGSILADGLVGELNPKQGEYLGKMLVASEHMLGMVNDLLDLSRVQAGKLVIETAPLALAATLRASLGGLAAAAAAKDQALLDRLPLELPPVSADEGRVRQVLANLVTNAIKYTNRGGTITLSARREGGFVRVEVADTGIGIAAEEQVRVFTPFTQVDMTNTRQVGGVGLGLGIVRALVEAHGGKVGLESTSGVGSVFWFTLPLARIDS